MPDWIFVLQCYSIIILGILIQLLQMIALYKDPHGGNVFKKVAITTQVRSSDTTGGNINTRKIVVAEEEDGSELTLLREKVTQLETELKLYKEREETMH